MIFESNGIKIENPGGMQLSHLRLIFEEMFELGMYNAIDVKDRDVLDIGAYYGETSVFFSKRGARRVIAIEPFESFNSIDKNAQLNGCTNIIPMRAALTPTLGIITIQGDYPNHGATRLSDGQFYANEKNSITISGITIAECVAMYQLNDAVLKIDAEGAERDAVITTSKEILRRFKQIVLEYHYRPMYEGEALAEFTKYVESCGFKTHLSFNRQMVSMFYADRVDEEKIPDWLDEMANRGMDDE